MELLKLGLVKHQERRFTPKAVLEADFYAEFKSVFKFVLGAVIPEISWLKDFLAVMSQREGNAEPIPKPTATMKGQQLKRLNFM